MYAGTAAAAAAGTTGAGGMWLFSYNKENFQYDAGMRFGKFTMARTFANAQVSQYREDIHGMTETTVSKMDAWQTICTCFIQVCAALSCAGRIGMHGAAPPGWFCALFSGCIFMSVLFFGLSLWLGMHAGLRAQCGATSLLTRKVRLPIPSMGQLDQARVFASSFEKQEGRDIFRVPFMRHAQDAPDMPPVEAEHDLSSKKGKKASPKDVHDPQYEFASTARDTVPSWIRDEVVVDKGGGFANEEQNPLHVPSQQPRHFELFTQAQEEWRDYDVYARISMLYGVASFMYAVCYYGIGTCITELRGFWVMWSMPMIFMASQALIMRLDIMKTGSHWLPHSEFLGHAAPYIAVAACTLEYRFYYSERQVVITWGLVMLCFFAHFVMALRFLDLCKPETSPAGEMPEEPGRQWWPNTWLVPSAFTRNLWFITPPKKLEPGQHCLIHEMEDMATHGGGISAASCKRRRAKGSVQRSAAASNEAETFTDSRPDGRPKNSNTLPWQMMRLCCLTAAFEWFFMMVVTPIEIVMGTETLLKPPGEPPWIRDTKYRHYSPSVVHLSTDGLPSSYRLFAATKARYPKPEGDSHGDYHRRLDENQSAQVAAYDELLKVLPILEELADKAHSVEAPIVTDQPRDVRARFMERTPQAMNVAWPSLFEPHHVLCGSNKALALSRRGVGALVDAGDDLSMATEAERFSLLGATEFGPIVGGAWMGNGLQLVTASGKVLRCAGTAPADGVWECGSVEGSLPTPAGSELLHAAVQDHSQPIFALVFKHMPHLAALYSSQDGTWVPMGEVHLPGGVASLSFQGDDLVVSLESGEVHHRGVREMTSRVHAAPASTAAHVFRSTCALPTGKLLQLALRQADTGSDSAWGPELILSP